MIFTEIIGQFEGVPVVEAKEESDEVVAVTVDTFEPGDNYPVVRHIFYGKTEKEARGYMESHKGTDKFFAACFKGKMGKVKCRNSTVTVAKVKRSEI